MTVPANVASSAAVSSTAARLWIDHRLPELVGELELVAEDAPLLVERRNAVEVVEPRLPDRDGRGMREQRTELADSLGVGRGSVVRVDPERGDDAVMRVGESPMRPCTSRFPFRS